MNYESCGPGTRGNNLVIWKTIMQRGALICKCKGCWVQLDRSQLIGPGELANGSDCKYCAGSPLSYCGSSHGEEDKG